MAKSLVICGFIDLPTTWRENKSSTTAKYSQPPYSDVGDVGDPNFVGLRDIELALQQIWRGKRWFAARFSWSPPIPSLRAQLLKAY